MLDARAEEGYFAFAKFLDQHMRDARDRQERIKEARKVMIAHVTHMVNKISEMNYWMSTQHALLTYPRSSQNY